MSNSAPLNLESHLFTTELIFQNRSDFCLDKIFVTPRFCSAKILLKQRRHSITKKKPLDRGFFFIMFFYYAFFIGMGAGFNHFQKPNQKKTKSKKTKSKKTSAEDFKKPRVEKPMMEILKMHI